MRPKVQELNLPDFSPDRTLEDDYSLNQSHEKSNMHKDSKNLISPT